MNVYRNRKTGIIIEISSEFGDDKVWEKVSPAPVAEKVKAEPVEEVKETPKKKTTARKAVKK